mmetsp:Transcript_96427/g.281809  ORF Transcript_96427/g.281809 Transcript_96427/m.281809 type:complete len:222 (+) Transcript_96427:405-1070(+)
MWHRHLARKCHFGKQCPIVLRGVRGAGQGALQGAEGEVGRGVQRLLVLLVGGLYKCLIQGGEVAPTKTLLLLHHTATRLNCYGPIGAFLDAQRSYALLCRNRLGRQAPDSAARAPAARGRGGRRVLIQRLIHCAQRIVYNLIQSLLVGCICSLKQGLFEVLYGVKSGRSIGSKKCAIGRLHGLYERVAARARASQPRSGPACTREADARGADGVSTAAGVK